MFKIKLNLNLDIKKVDDSKFNDVLSKFKATINPIFFNILVLGLHAIKVFFGGRGSGKSYAFAQCLIYIALTIKVKVLCLRVYQASLNDSVYSALKDLINSNGLSSYFTILKTSIICNKTGSEIIFKGMQNMTSLKSYHGIDICWIEEAVGTGKSKRFETLNKEDFKTLDNTIRKQGSQIWISFNPSFAEDFPYVEWAGKLLDSDKTYDDNYTYVRKINFDENPYFYLSSLGKKEENERGSGDYANIWLGDCEASTIGYPFRSMQISYFDYASWGIPQLVFLDPAFGGADYNGLTLVWYRDSKFYCLSKGWRGGIDKTIEVLKNLPQTKRLAVESNNLGVEVARAIKYALGISIEIFRSKGDKFERIVNVLEPKLSNIIVHSSSDRILDIKNYSKLSAHDDQIDSVASAILLLTDSAEYDRMIKETDDAYLSGKL